MRFHELLEKMEAAMQISILQPSYRASASRICFVAVFCSDSSPSLRSHSMNAPVLVLKDSLKRESGTKVHHGNIQASKAVADIIRTTLGPRSVLPKHLLNRVTILLSYAEDSMSPFYFQNKKSIVGKMASSPN